MGNGPLTFSLKWASWTQLRFALHTESFHSSSFLEVHGASSMHMRYMPPIHFKAHTTPLHFSLNKNAHHSELALCEPRNPCYTSKLNGSFPSLCDCMYQSNLRIAARQLIPIPALRHTQPCLALCHRRISSKTKTTA